MGEYVTGYLLDEPGLLSKATQRLLRDALEQVAQPIPKPQEKPVPLFMYAKKSGKSAAAKRWKAQHGVE
jgi:hypothetical protein